MLWRCWCSTSISTRGSGIWERRYLYLGDEWSTRGSTKGHCGWCSDCLWLGIREFAFKTLNSLAHLGMRLAQISIFLMQLSMVLFLLHPELLLQLWMGTFLFLKLVQPFI